MSEDLSGQTIGDYHFIREIGKGGMGRVYLAKNLKSDSTYAVKVLLGERAIDPRFVARFEREARLAKELRHHNIVRIYEVGCTDQIHYLVMDHVDGQALNEILRQQGSKPLDLAYAVTICQKIADALTYAYEGSTIIHRDIKPANILVDKNGSPHLTDFGIARALEEDSDLTTEEHAIGTPLYMSPEHFMGGTWIEHRSDIYCLGLILYEMVTGRHPFGNGQTPKDEIKEKQAKDLFTLPCQLNRALPEVIEQVILIALARHPDERFQTSADMAHALQNAYRYNLAPIPPSRSTLTAGLNRSMLPVTKKRSNWAVLALATILVLFGVGLTVWALSQILAKDNIDVTVTPPPLTPTSIPTPPPTPTSLVITLTIGMPMRDGPGMVYPEQALLPANMPLQLLGKSSQGDWVKVKAPDESVGWVKRADLELDTAEIAMLPPALEPPTPTTTPTLIFSSTTPSVATVIPTPTFQPVATSTSSPTLSPTLSPSPTPTSVSTTPVTSGQPCPVQLTGPPDMEPFTSADEIKLTWASPRNPAGDQFYRLSFFRPGNPLVYINGLKTRVPFSVKSPGRQNWTYPNLDGSPGEEWIAGLVENAAYIWMVEVVDKNDNPLCESEKRTFIWNLHQ